jgi:hypothetical protein
MRVININAKTVFLNTHGIIMQVSSKNLLLPYSVCEHKNIQEASLSNVQEHLGVVNSKYEEKINHKSKMKLNDTLNLIIPDFMY